MMTAIARPSGDQANLRAVAPASPAVSANDSARMSGAGRPDGSSMRMSCEPPSWSLRYTTLRPSGEKRGIALEDMDAVLGSVASKRAALGLSTSQIQSSMS
jgi:hypothetical protein